MVYSLKTFILSIWYYARNSGLQPIIMGIEDMLLSKNTILIYAY